MQLRLIGRQDSIMNDHVKDSELHANRPVHVCGRPTDAAARGIVAPVLRDDLCVEDVPTIGPRDFVEFWQALCHVCHTSCEGRRLTVDKMDDKPVPIDLWLCQIAVQRCWHVALTLRKHGAEWLTRHR